MPLNMNTIAGKKVQNNTNGQNETNTTPAGQANQSQQSNKSTSSTNATTSQPAAKNTNTATIGGTNSSTQKTQTTSVGSANNNSPGGLSQNAQNKINQYKSDWEKAHAAGDAAGMERARRNAERVRNSEGYYSSDDGSELKRIDQAYVDKNVAQQKQNWNTANANKDTAGMQKAHEEAEYYRGLLGYSGGADGSQRITQNQTRTVQTPDYTGMNYSQKYEAAKAANDTYGMAEAAYGAYMDRYNQGYYGGVDGSQKIPIAPVTREINELTAQMNDAYNRGDSEAVTQLSRQIEQKYDSIGMVAADDGNVYAKTELNLRIEQDKRRWYECYQRGDYAGADQAHQDAVWCDRQLGNYRNDDGSISTPINYQTVAAANNQNSMTQIRVGSDGNPVAVLNPDGTVDYNYRGILYSDNGTTDKQYIVTTGSDGQQKFVPVSGNVTEFYAKNPDGSLNYGVFTDPYGNTLRASNFVFGSDGYSYDTVTGKNLNELASQYSLNPDNFVMKISYRDGTQKFFNIKGQEVSSMMDTAQRQDVQDFDEQSLNDMMNAMLGAGYNNVPQWSDFDTLTWDQALATAEEQVNGAFNKQLDTTLDKLNTNALQTGFYGQLPTEQLRQNAVAESEVERQQAIYELANQLQAASQTEAQRRFEDAMQTSQQRINTVTTVFQNIYQLVRDRIADLQAQEGFDIQREGNAATREANYLNYLATTYQGQMELLGYCVQAIANPSEYGNTTPATNLYNRWNSALQTPTGMLENSVLQQIQKTLSNQTK